MVEVKWYAPSIHQDDISIADLFYGVLGNGFSSYNYLFVNVALDTVQQFALCLQQKESDI